MGLLKRFWSHLTDLSWSKEGYVPLDELTPDNAGDSLKPVSSETVKERHRNCEPPVQFTEPFIVPSEFREVSNVVPNSSNVIDRKKPKADSWFITHIDIIGREAILRSSNMKTVVSFRLDPDDEIIARVRSRRPEIVRDYNIEQHIFPPFDESELIPMEDKLISIDDACASFVLKDD